MSAEQSLNSLAIGAQIVEQIGVEAQSCIHANQTRIAFRLIACIFQCLPGAFQKDPMLGIHELRLFRLHAEKASVEQIHTVQDAASLHKVRVGSVERDELQLVVGKVGDRFDAVSEI